MKIDKLLKRKEQDVKAIRTYNSHFTIHSTDEMGNYNQGIIGKKGSGRPRLLLDIKFNEKRGEEIDIVFMGEREERKNFNPEEKEEWSSFGHIVLSKEQTRELLEKLHSIIGDKLENKNFDFREWSPSHCSYCGNHLSCSDCLVYGWKRDIPKDDFKGEDN